MPKITEHFTMEAMTYSAKAKKLGIDNTPPIHLSANAVRLCTELENQRKILEERFGEEIPMHENSGYRCEALNNALGGSGSKPGQKPSAHMDFRALDWVPGNCADIKQAFDAIRLAGPSKAPGLDKIILERNKETGGWWIHSQVARAGEKPLRQAFIAEVVDGDATYTPVECH